MKTTQARKWGTASNSRQCKYGLGCTTIAQWTIRDGLSPTCSCALTRSSRGDTRETETVPADLLEAIFT